MLEDFVGVVEEKIGLREGEYYVVAHSFGCRIAVLLANKYPERIEKMVLTGAAGIKPRFNLKVWLKIKLYKLWKKLKNKGRGFLTGSADYRNLNTAGKITFQNIIKRDLKQEIKKLTVPTLLIWGKCDKSTPLYMGKLWTRIQKDSILKCYRQAGHFCFVDESIRFTGDAIRFFESKIKNEK